MDAIRFAVTFSTADWLALQRACLERIARAPEPFWTDALNFALFVSFTGALLALGQNVLAVLTGAAVAFLFHWLNSRRLARKLMPEPNGGFFAPCEYALGAEGLVIVSANATAHLAWRSVTEITSTGTHLFLWIDRLQALIVPARVVPAGQELEEWRRVLAAWRQAAIEAPGQGDGSARHAAHAAELDPHAERPESNAAHESEQVPRAAAPQGVTAPSVSAARRRQDDLATPVHPGPIRLALLSLAAVGTWVVIDWFASRPDPEFLSYGLPGVAWNILGVLALGGLLSGCSSPRVPFQSALASLLVLAPGAVLLQQAVYWGVPRTLYPWLLVVTIVGAAGWLSRSAWRASGRRQPLAVSLVVLAALGFRALSTEIGVTASLWYSAEPYEENALEWLAVEPLLFAQSARIDAALAAVDAGSDAADVFFLGFAGYGEQRVFAEEIRFAASAVDARYDSRTRSLMLLNDRRDFQSHPLATTSTLRAALRGVAARMNTEQDVLFLALSSHGSSNHTLSVNNAQIPLEDLSPETLALLLDEAGIKWRVIVISACYSGGFIDALRSPSTAIITAAAADRTSFGCADDRDLTYFGEAFYRDALPASASLRLAFDTARRSVLEREAREGIPVPSNPQAHFGTQLVEKLDSIERARNVAR